MAAFKGVNMTKLTTFPVDYPDASEVGGRVRVFFDTYVASGLAAGSTIAVARLPKGARVWDIHVFHDDLGTASGTLSVGDAGSATRYLSAFPTGTAGKQTMTGTNGVSTGVGFEQTAETDVLITTAGAPITGTIRSVVYYTLD